MYNEKHIKRCYELAIKAGKKGFDTFGAILVHNDEILEELIAEMDEVKRKNK
jgi:diketogulonate reductase-like aldo/keto reductase